MNRNQFTASFNYQTHTAAVQKNGADYISVAEQGSDGALSLNGEVSPEEMQAVLFAICEENQRLHTQNNQLNQKSAAQTQLLADAMQWAKKTMWLTSPGTSFKNTCRKIVIGIVSLRPVQWLLERPFLQNARQFWAKKLLG